MLWDKLSAEDRQAKIDETIERAGNNERIADIAASFGISDSYLTTAMRFYAIRRWRNVIIERERFAVEETKLALTNSTPENLARAKAAHRLAIDRLELALGRAVRRIGRETKGKCPNCAKDSVYANMARKATCYSCGWQGGTLAYLRGIARREAARAR